MKFCPAKISGCMVARNLYCRELPAVRNMANFPFRLLQCDNDKKMIRQVAHFVLFKSILIWEYRTKVVINL